jgi:hypothetical protein
MDMSESYTIDQPNININQNINQNDLKKINNEILKTSWTEEHERIMLILHKYANIQYKLYHKTYIRYKKKLGYYRIPIIIITGIMGLLSISNSGYVPKTYTKWISLLVGMTNVAVTIISLIETFKKIDITKTQSLESYMNYKKINDEISLILRLPQHERKDSGINIINKYFLIFEKCQMNSPVLKIKTKDLFELHKLDDVLNNDIDTEPDKTKWMKTFSNIKNSITSKSSKTNKLNKINNTDLLSNSPNIFSSSNSEQNDLSSNNSENELFTNIEEGNKKNLNENMNINIENLNDLKNFTNSSKINQNIYKNNNISEKNNETIKENITNTMENNIIEEEKTNNIIEEKTNDIDISNENN